MSRLATSIVLVFLALGCDPVLHLITRPDSDSYRSLGYRIDTLGITLNIHSVMQGTRSNPSPLIVVGAKFTTERQITFPLKNSILIDRDGWKRRVISASRNGTRVPADFIFQPLEEVSIHLYFDDNTLVEFPAKLLLPVVSFSSTGDTLRIPDAVIEGPVPER